MGIGRNEAALSWRMTSQESIAACANKRRREQQDASKHKNDRTPERARKKTHNEQQFHIADPERFAAGERICRA